MMRTISVLVAVVGTLFALSTRADETLPADSNNNCERCNFAAYANAASPLMFGLSATIEGGASFAGWARLRSGNLGLAIPLYESSSGDHVNPAFGFAAGGRWYSAGRGNLRGFYAGLGVEYIPLSGSGDRKDWTMPVVVSQIDLGYRWVWGRFLMGVGGWVGPAIIVGHEWKYQDTGAVVQKKKGVYPAGELVFDLGMVL